jgi:uncharacterized radical SAM superfamily protein
LTQKFNTKEEEIKIFNSEDEVFLQEVFAEARDLANKKFGRVINFFYTSKFFPPITVTGTKCAYNCLHCQKRLLGMMIPAEKPQTLINKCIRLEKNGAKGILISGGCLPDFTVPIEKFADAIKLVKKKTRLLIIAHTGLLNEKRAKILSRSKLDGVAIDIVGSSETTKAIYGVKIQKKKYIETLNAVKKAHFQIVSPHICVGLHFGKLLGELEALRIVSAINPTTIVLTVLMPLADTSMREYLVKPLDVAKVIALAKIMFPNTPITLGCARSKGVNREKIEEIAISAGITNIAMPTRRAYETAKSYGLKIKNYGACCGVPPSPHLELSAKKITE